MRQMTRLLRGLPVYKYDQGSFLLICPANSAATLVPPKAKTKTILSSIVTSIELLLFSLVILQSIYGKQMGNEILDMGSLFLYIYILAPSQTHCRSNPLARPAISL